MAENQNSGRKSVKSSKVKAKTMHEIQPQHSAPPVHDMLGQKLKAYYAEIAGEPISERLRALLAKLEAQSAKGANLDEARTVRTDE
jgi:DNA-binding protein Fis